VQSPNVNVGYGGVYVSTGYGGMLQQAIFEGRGLPNPRTVGGGLAAVGGALFAFCFLTTFFLHWLYYYPIVAAPPTLLTGLFMLATNEPLHRADGSKPPSWTRVALASLFIGGIGIGIGLIIFWTRWFVWW